MNKYIAKRPPRPDRRQTWEPFIRLPKEWEAVKQSILQRNLKEPVLNSAVS